MVGIYLNIESFSQFCKHIDTYYGEEKFSYEACEKMYDYLMEMSETDGKPVNIELLDTFSEVCFFAEFIEAFHLEEEWKNFVGICSDDDYPLSYLQDSIKEKFIELLGEKGLFSFCAMTSIGSVVVCA